MYKLLIDEKKDRTSVFVEKNNIIVEQYEEYNEKKRLEGNIYLGKVTNIVEGMQAAFVDVGIEKKALIHIEDIIPKESEIFGNSNIDIKKYKLKDYIKQEEEIIIQIQKDCYNQKGPRATKHIKLTGQYLVLMPFSKFITVSKKIEDDKEKQRITKIVNNYCEGYGVIIRTACFGKTEDIIRKDLENLINMWENIKENAKKVKSPSILYDNDGIVGKLITDFKPLGLTNSQKIKKQLEKENVKVEFDKNFSKDVIAEKKIWLNSGAYITIDRTEALIAIDVNTGKYTGKKDINETVLKVNLEASKEIVKQIILQDLGGIIIIDFIDMFSDGDREKVRNCVMEEFKSDRSQVNVLEFTKLGLLEITRKNILSK